MKLRKKYWLGTGTTAAVLLLVAASQAAGPAGGEDLPQLGDVANGKHLYNVHCAVCHGFDGNGDGPGAQDLDPPPAVHRDGNLMNSRDDEMLLRTVLGGCAAAGCKGSMPGFDDALGQVDAWDLVAYLRTLHLPLRRFFPLVGEYLVKSYTIGKIGGEQFRRGQMERLQKQLGRSEGGDLTQTVFTLFRAEKPHESPRLVPQEPQKLAELNKGNKIGYVLFLTLKEPRGRSVPLALALNAGYSITALEPVPLDPALRDQLKGLLSKYVGLGQRGQALELKASKDKTVQHFNGEIKRLYLLAVESANCYEAEERERSWADGTF